MKCAEETENCPRWLRREAHNASPMPRSIEDSLEILAHGAELGRANIECVTDSLGWAVRAQIDCLAQVVNIQQLIAVVPGTQHREAAAAVSPVIQQLERPQ